MRGGPRNGAGRRKGTQNRGVTAAKTKAEVRAEAAASGETPLDYMLRVLRDPTVDYKRRDAMAVQAAPYLHAKLASVQVTGKDGGPIEYSTDARDKIAHILNRQAASGDEAGTSKTTH